MSAKKSCPKSKTGNGLILIIVESIMEQPLVSNIDTMKVVVSNGKTVGFDEESLSITVSPREFVRGNHE